MHELSKGIKVPKKGTIRLPIDASQIKSLFGQTNFNDEVEDFEKFFMQNDG